ncbi:MAG: hypothetical protein ABI823_21140 [Bryobacteraceae bacterium]
MRQAQTAKHTTMGSHEMEPIGSVPRDRRWNRPHFGIDVLTEDLRVGSMKRRSAADRALHVIADGYACGVRRTCKETG